MAADFSRLKLTFEMFLIENNSGAKIHCHLCSIYGENNVMNLKNIQQWQSMFQKGRTNIHDNIANEQPNIMLRWQQNAPNKPNKEGVHEQMEQTNILYV